jgi:F-type H+-transporting ATPase subunit a
VVVFLDEATPTVVFCGLSFDLAIIISSILVAVLIFLLVFFAGRKARLVPKKLSLQNMLELVLELTKKITATGFENVRRIENFWPFIFTLFMYVFFANQLGVLCMLSTKGPLAGFGAEAANAEHIIWVKSPTADLSGALALAVLVALVSQGLVVQNLYRKIRQQGFGRQLKSLFCLSSLKASLKHLPMEILHILEGFIKPLTHSMRLFANIFTGEVLIGMMLHMGKIWYNGLALLPWMAFSLFVGFIQAYIFTTLASVYMGQKVNMQDSLGGH